MDLIISLKKFLYCVFFPLPFSHLIVMESLRISLHRQTVIMKCLQVLLSWPMKMKESPILISNPFTFPVVDFTVQWLKKHPVLIKLYPEWHCVEHTKKNCAVPWTWCQLPCFSFVWFDILKSQLMLLTTMYTFGCQPGLNFHKRTAGEVLALRQLLG